MAKKKRIANISDQADLRKSLGHRLKVYENDWDDLLDKELQHIFVSEVYERVKLIPDYSENIFRRIVREICTIYKQPAKRGLEGFEDGNPRWEALTEEIGLDNVMAEAHRLSKACTVSFLHVRASENPDKIRVFINTPDLSYVEEDPNDPGKMTAYAYRVTGKNTKKRDVSFWVYYTDEDRLFLDSSGFLSETHPLTGEYYDQENKYGIIPVVPCHAVWPVRRFWRPNWNKDAFRANIVIGVLETFANNLVKNNSFKQIWISAANASDKLKNSILDTAFPMDLGKDASAGVLDLTTSALDQIDRRIKSKVSAIANNYGISAENFSISGNVQSGFALKIRNRALEEIREADIPLWTEVEKQLYRVVKAVNDTDFNDKLPDTELVFNPGEVKFPETWEVEEKRWVFEFKHGVSNPVDYIIKRDPQLSRDEAVKRLKNIREENDQIKKRVGLAEMLAESLTGAEQ